LNTNRTYISNLINDETGCNFNTWVNRYRIEHALEIMNRHGSNLLVTEYIAHESGFGSPSSFIRAFKTHTGLTPGKYLQERALQQVSLNNPE
ncbi:MAG: AraC family transcriptional regulator, partial [Bacteroidales bacterium]|nr:AraC family transcriptional regulator [Bacteroidales bacterium]